MSPGDGSIPAGSAETITRSPPIAHAEPGRAASRCVGRTFDHLLNERDNIDLLALKSKVAHIAKGARHEFNFEKADMRHAAAPLPLQATPTPGPQAFEVRTHP